MLRGESLTRKTLIELVKWVYYLFEILSKIQVFFVLEEQ